ncbi:MAG TPA: hypothetical protein VHQ87_07770, partial [Rhizobacter sp.]|nr:hypothetical protein [Rhizobacter sp.]
MTRRWTLLGVVLLATQARAGGHFDVDDAGVLEPGECQNEIWGGHTTVKTVNFLHIGPSCRAGPVELGLNYDGLRATENRFDLVGPQLKWGFYGQEPGAVIAAALAFSAF